MSTWNVAPAELRERRQWVLWSSEDRGGKKTKIPRTIGGGFAKSNDPTTWASYEEVVAAIEADAAGRYAGLGYVFAADDPYVGVDFDGCLVDGRVADWAEEWVEWLAVSGGYIEVSPSGNGLKAWIRGTLPGSGGSRAIGEGEHTGVEIYDRGRYFCVTENVRRASKGGIGEGQAAVDAIYNFVKPPKLPKPPKPQRPITARPATTPTPHNTNATDSALGHYAAKAFAEEVRLAATAESPGRNEQLNRSAFNLGQLVAAGALDREEVETALMNAAEEVGLIDSYGASDTWGSLQSGLNAGLKFPRDLSKVGEGDRWANTAPDDPARIAHEHMLSHQHKGRPTLMYYRGEWLEWRDGAWRRGEASHIRPFVTRTVTSYLHGLNQSMDAEGKHCRKATGNIISDTMRALEAECVVGGEIEAPAWLNGRADWDAKDVLAMNNKLVHLPSLMDGRPATAEHTPDFFVHGTVGYDHQPNAPEPTHWLQFLNDLWGDDPQSVELLQEWCGYLLTRDTSMQKILLLIGPPRSGKGTLDRVIQRLVGLDSVASPKLDSMATNFGLAPLIGKTFASIPDTRLGRQDQAPIVERLLSISGEDSLTVDVKFKSAWNGRLGTRLMITSNELPRLLDSSGALTSRILLLQTRRSFAGKEDRGLEAKLLAELPAIFNWAIEGLKRLLTRGRFVQPDSGKELLEQMGDLTSPVGQFVRECCIVGEEEKVLMSDLYGAWRVWCREEGRDHPGTQNSFGRDLLAACPDVRRTNPTWHNNKRGKCYLGVSLQTDLAPAIVDDKAKANSVPPKVELCLSERF